MPINTKEDFLRELNVISEKINPQHETPNDVLVKGMGRKRQGVKMLDEDPGFKLEQVRRKLKSGEDITNKDLAIVRTALQDWEQARQRNNRAARFFLNLLPILLTGPFFHLFFWGIEKGIVARKNKKIESNFLLSDDEKVKFRWDWTKSIKPVGESFSTIKLVDKFLADSEEFKIEKVLDEDQGENSEEEERKVQERQLARDRSRQQLEQDRIAAEKADGDNQESSNEEEETTASSSVDSGESVEESEGVPSSTQYKTQQCEHNPKGVVGERGIKFFDPTIIDPSLFSEEAKYVPPTKMMSIQLKELYNNLTSPLELGFPGMCELPVEDFVDTKDPAFRQDQSIRVYPEYEAVEEPSLTSEVIGWLWAKATDAVSSATSSVSRYVKTGLEYATDPVGSFGKLFRAYFTVQTLANVKEETVQLEGTNGDAKVFVTLDMEKAMAYVYSAEDNTLLGQFDNAQAMSETFPDLVVKMPENLLAIEGKKEEPVQATSTYRNLYYDFGEEPFGQKAKPKVHSAHPPIAFYLDTSSEDFDANECYGFDRELAFEAAFQKPVRDLDDVPALDDSSDLRIGI